MAVPDFQTMMNYVLDICANSNCEIGQRQIESEIAKRLNLSEEDQNLMLGSKRETVLRSNVYWATRYLFKAGLLERPKRGYFKITETGKSENQRGSKINVKYLKKFPSFVDFYSSHRKNKKEISDDIEVDTKAQTPDEMIFKAQTLKFNDLQNELLDRLKQVDPVRFERIVLDLMEKMNYGIGQMTKLSHDGGIDGIIDEDELGLEKIYLQAKRYSDNKVNEREIQNFIGALGCSPVQKGVFITTSFFNEKAKKKAETAQGKVLRLIDGEELTQLMIRHNIGVQLETKIEFKKIDKDFFNEEE